MPHEGDVIILYHFRSTWLKPIFSSARLRRYRPRLLPTTYTFHLWFESLFNFSLEGVFMSLIWESAEFTDEAASLRAVE